MRYYLDGKFFAEWYGPAHELAEFSDVDISRLSCDAAMLRSELLRQLMAQYESRTALIAAGYPASERESWPVQTTEARAVLSDASVDTPWIDAAATARGLERIALAKRIAAKDAAYRSIHGALTGARQRIEDAIDKASDDAAALSKIDVAVGWPKVEAA